VRHLKTGFWPARRFAELRQLDEQYADWRDRTCNRRTHATGRFPVEERLVEERQVLRPLSPLRFDWSGHRSTRVPIDGYLRHGGCFYRAPERLVHERVELRFDRDQVWIVHRGSEVARYPRSYEQGVSLPPPILRAEPPAVLPPLALPRLTVAPPELSDYAELCA
jgi:Mu transposase, C-terminal domain